MHKAYERVKWDFLVAVMQRLRFGQAWCKLVLRCISSVNFCILINGNPRKKFAPSRGLRQGDPLSPYIFLFVSEVFSLLISRVCDQHALVGVQLNWYALLSCIFSLQMIPFCFFKRIRKIMVLWSL